MYGSPSAAPTVPTIPHLLLARATTDAALTALISPDQGRFRTETWGELLADVRRYAVGLFLQGIRPGDRVAQYSENRREWILLDLAIQLAQAVHVPIHAPLTGVQVAEQVTDSGATALFLSNQELALKLHAAASLFPQGIRIFSHEPVDLPPGGRIVERWEEVARPDEALADRLTSDCLARLQADSLATILYTSGTTGEPKGVMLNQRNLVSNVLGTIEAMGVSRDDLRLGFLPLSHIFARTCDLYTWIGAGSRFALATSRETVVADCRRLHPTILNGVPYFFQLLQRALESQGQADRPGALRELLGGQIRICCSGGAALPDHLFDYFQSQQVPLLQGYGLTESSPVITVSSPAAVRRSAVGRPIQEVQVRIANDGEILTRGPHVMVGYWNKPEATAEIIQDGWLHTGDIGRLDDDGYLYITGRKKELIVTAAGKNIAPVQIECLLTEDPLISQAMVIGDDRSYLTALIVPEVNQLLERLGSGGEAVDPSQLRDDPRLRDLLASVLQQRLSNLSHHEQIRKFAIIERPFSIESGELTPKLSLKRKVIEQNYAAQIDAMYQR